MTVAIGEIFGERIVLLSDTMISDDAGGRPEAIPGALKSIVLTSEFSVAFSGPLAGAEEYLRLATIRSRRRQGYQLEFLAASHMPTPRLCKVYDGQVAAGANRYWIGTPIEVGPGAPQRPSDPDRTGMTEYEYCVLATDHRGIAVTGAHYADSRQRCRDSTNRFYMMIPLRSHERSEAQGLLIRRAMRIFAIRK